MPSQEQREELALLLIGLFVKPWLRFYVRTEREAISRYRRHLDRIKGVENRAKERYRSVLSDFPSVETEGGTKIRTTRPRILRMEQAMDSVYVQPFSKGGQIDRQLMRDLRDFTAMASEELRARRAEIDSMLRAFSAELELEEAQDESLSSKSTWAARRDIELLARKATHRASLAAMAVSDSGHLTTALRDASSVTRLPRSATRNSLQGSMRESVRAAVHRGATRVGLAKTWVGLKPFAGGSGSIFPRTETQWTRHASALTRGQNWKPGNPVASYGLHVGSRSYFAPLVSQDTLLFLAGAALVFVPDLLRRIERESPIPSYDRRQQPVFTVGGRRVDSPAAFVDLIERELRVQVAAAGPLPVPEEEIEQQPPIVAEVINRFDGQTNDGRDFTTLAIDKGRLNGVEIDMVFLVTSQLPPPVRKGQATVIALYPDTATLLFLPDPRSEEPRLFDRASTLGS
jgi:hypothetical protein